MKAHGHAYDAYVLMFLHFVPYKTNSFRRCFIQQGLLL